MENVGMAIAKSIYVVIPLFVHFLLIPIPIAMFLATFFQNVLSLLIQYFSKQSSDADLQNSLMKNECSELTCKDHTDYYSSRPIYTIYRFA